MATLTLPVDELGECEVGDTKVVTLAFTVTDISEGLVTGEAEVESVEESGEEVAEGEEEVQGEEVIEKPKVGPRAGLTPAVVIAISGKKK
jgi:hypothetical protein